MEPNRTRILFVHDEARSLGRYAGVLEESYGFDVFTARDVESGKEFLEDRGADCVLSGLGMTGDDAFELLEWVREHHPDLPFVVLTSETSRESVERAIHAGVTDFVFEFTLNISFELLALRLRRAVRAGGTTGDGTDGTDVTDEESGAVSVEASTAATDNGSDSLVAVVERAIRGGSSDGVSGRRDDESGPDAGGSGDAGQTVRAETSERGPDRETGEDGVDAGVTSADTGVETPEWWDFGDGDDGADDDGKTGSDDGWVWTRADRSTGPESDGDRTEQIDVAENVALGEDEPGRLDEILTDIGPDGVSNGEVADDDTGRGRNHGDEPGDELLQLVDSLLDEEDGDASDGTRSIAERTTRSNGTGDGNRSEVEGGDAEPESGDSGEPGVREGDDVGAGSDGSGTGDVGITQHDGGPDHVRANQDEMGGLIDAGEYRTPEDLDLEPGTNVLVQCSTHDDRRQAACLDLLGVNEVAGKYVLLIRYRRMAESKLERIAADARQVKVISIGYSQPIPASVQDSVEAIQINDPNDVTRLGIVMSGTVDDWDPSGDELVVCYDSLNVLLRYKNTQSAFRFLHVFLNKLQSSGAVAHFHVDPSAGDPQEINTLKPLFDASMSIDSVGTHLESQ